MLANTKKYGLQITAVLFGAVFATAAQGQDFNLRFAGGVGSAHPAAQAAEYWVDQVNELSDGEVSVRITWGGALLPLPEIMPGVGDGRADLGKTSSPVHPGELPISQLITVPFQAYNAEAAARAMNDLYREDEKFRAEYERQGVHMLSAIPLDVVLIGSADKYENIDDLSGLQIRAVGAWQDAISGAGAQPVGVPYGELYEALQRGVVDGYGLNFEGIYDIKLHEVAPYMHNPGVGAVAHMNIVISTDVWEGLTDTARSAMEQAVEAMLNQVAEIYASNSQPQCVDMVANGGQFEMWSEAAIEEWKSAVGQSLLDEWAQSTGDVEHAMQFHKRYQELIDKYSEDSNWQSAFGICERARQ